MHAVWLFVSEFCGSAASELQRVHRVNSLRVATFQEVASPPRLSVCEAPSEMNEAQRLRDEEIRAKRRRHQEEQVARLAGLTRRCQKKEQSRRAQFESIRQIMTKFIFCSNVSYGANKFSCLFTEYFTQCCFVFSMFLKLSFRKYSFPCQLGHGGTE